MKALITRKVGMTSTIADDGTVHAITLLSATDNVVTQIKTGEADGYQAVQIGFEEDKKQTKSVLGHLKPSKTNAKILREIRTENDENELKVGDPLSADLFSVGDIVHATGTSKGKGWAGTIKRHNFHRQRKTHGGKGNTRKPGSIGSMYPQKIFKGKKMAGQMGNERCCVQNLEVVRVDAERGLLLIKGGVPGSKGADVIVSPAMKSRA